MGYKIEKCKDVKIQAQYGTVTINALEMDYLDITDPTKINDLFNPTFPILVSGKGVKGSQNAPRITIKSYATTKETVLNFFNTLDTVETTHTIYVSDSMMRELTDEEKAIATNKGWTISTTW